MESEVLVREYLQLGLAFDPSFAGDTAA